MEFGSCDDFSEFFHVSWLDIDNICVDEMRKYEDRDGQTIKENH
jgi:hypothetical protein